ncbi:hypothetical protein IMG5_104850 [Ichthyophthirius multifiliis]|uniref:Aldehyde dehydrogenase domain-containing protein n=1 Tax=Ichthyophthirius multifiliis TaxID=5932 RepID=G0QSZ2_ICHMU|nr:hypothetical protein IMG5_104850 [Ichthyophthirius multifiliis]EGR31663.1 hypothetical protein IMG5_104850 [Ichthyophthirius multifiliis]|eukprot:XP_004035149.1 hypothetical protein IMG5_104850 [Ichthyophthirius multifiliis]
MIQKQLQKVLQRNFSEIPSWATCNPYKLNKSNPYKLQNFVKGEWRFTREYTTIVDPLNGEKILQVPETKDDELTDFINNVKQVPLSGLHNPLKNPQRYQQYGQLLLKLSEELRKPEIEKFFTVLTQRVMPKSYIQAQGEVVVTRRFLENFTGDNPRFLSKSFSVPGDHQGQQSTGYRWPYGPVSIICPFNFPIEIPVLQLFGALITGNRPTLRVDSKVALVMEQFQDLPYIMVFLLMIQIF